MAEIDGGRIAARQLSALGIDHLFGVVAGPMIELFGGAQAEGMKVVGNRLELNGCFMASAWGWQEKKPGVFIIRRTCNGLGDEGVVRAPSGQGRPGRSCRRAVVHAAPRPCRNDRPRSTSS